MRLLRLIGQGVLIAGFLVFSYPIASWVYADAFQKYASWKFAKEKSAYSGRVLPPFSSSSGLRTPSPEPHSVLGRLEIPSVDLSVMVVEGDQDDDLLVGAGHVPGTAMPGVIGNVAIAGHRDTFFRALKNIHANDQIVLTTRDGSYHYVVDSTEITDPSNLGVLKAQGDQRLTLITCYPFTYIGNAPERFIVHARLAADPS